MTINETSKHSGSQFMFQDTPKAFHELRETKITSYKLEINRHILLFYVYINYYLVQFQNNLVLKS